MSSAHDLTSWSQFCDSTPDPELTAAPTEHGVRVVTTDSSWVDYDVPNEWNGALLVYNAISTLFPDRRFYVLTRQEGSSWEFVYGDRELWTEHYATLFEEA